MTFRTLPILITSKAPATRLDMINRRQVLSTCCALTMLLSQPALGQSEQPFTAAAFRAAQREGRSILVEIHASWCAICKAQTRVLSRLLADPKFKDIVVFRVDFDAQKAEVRAFGASMQSTLITFQGGDEVARSVGDTDANVIADLLSLAL